MVDLALGMSDVHKAYGETRALAGFDLAVERGEVFGLLGPNGAGKTTAVRVAATLARPDRGTVTVDGVDALAAPQLARGRLGLAGQYAAVDEKITGRENLVMFGRLYRLGRSGAAARADELLDRFALTAAAHRLVCTYSGGMRRRLDLAASLIIAPAVLFLDEPTTGLDPRARTEVWSSITDLAARGTTVVLTTQYLDEADRLAGRIAVVDAGRVIASGTPDELKRTVGGDRLEVVVESPQDLPEAAAILEGVAAAEPHIDAAARRIAVTAAGGCRTLVEAVLALDRQAIRTEDIAVRRSTLDDVFLALTGHAARSDAGVPAGVGR